MATRTTELVAEPGERVEVLLSERVIGEGWFKGTVLVVEAEWRRFGASVFYRVRLETPKGRSIQRRVHESHIRKPQQP